MSAAEGQFTRALALDNSRPSRTPAPRGRSPPPSPPPGRTPRKPTKWSLGAPSPSHFFNFPSGRLLPKRHGLLSSKLVAPPLCLLSDQTKHTRSSAPDFSPFSTEHPVADGRSRPNFAVLPGEPPSDHLSPRDQLAHIRCASSHHSSSHVCRAFPRTSLTKFFPFSSKDPAGFALFPVAISSGPRAGTCEPPSEVAHPRRSPRR